MGDRSRVDAAYTGKINHVIRELEFWACDLADPWGGTKLNHVDNCSTNHASVMNFCKNSRHQSYSEFAVLTILCISPHTDGRKVLCP